MFCSIPSSAVRILFGFLSHFGITLSLSYTVTSTAIRFKSFHSRSRSALTKVFNFLSFFSLFFLLLFLPLLSKWTILMLLAANLIVLTTASVFQITSQIAWKKTLVLIVCNTRDVNRALINSPCMLTTLNDRGCSSVVSALRCWYSESCYRGFKSRWRQDEGPFFSSSNTCVDMIIKLRFVGISQADQAGLEKAPRWAKICSEGFQTKTCLDFVILSL